MKFLIINFNNGFGNTVLFNSSLKLIKDKIKSSEITILSNNRDNDVLNKLNQNFVLFHLSANNSLPLKKIKGKFIPQLLEFSYVRKDLISKLKISQKTLPIKNLDCANKPYKPDFKNFYPFKSYASKKNN